MLKKSWEIIVVSLVLSSRRVKYALWSRALLATALMACLLRQLNISLVTPFASIVSPCPTTLTKKTLVSSLPRPHLQGNQLYLATGQTLPSAEARHLSHTNSPRHSYQSLRPARGSLQKNSVSSMTRGRRGLTVYRPRTSRACPRLPFRATWTPRWFPMALPQTQPRQLPPKMTTMRTMTKKSQTRPPTPTPYHHRARGVASGNNHPSKRKRSR